MKKTISELRLPALEVQQTRRRKLYSFAVDGKRLHLFAAVSRLHRNQEAQIGGYQRPEVIAHVAGIRSYLESEDPMLPNAIVVAFDSRVHFAPYRRMSANGYSRSG